MLVGQDNFITTTDGGKIKISSIHGKLDNVFVDDNEVVTLLSIKHHKKYKVMIKIIFEDDTYIIVGKHTYLQVVEEHDIGKIIEACEVHPGQLLCPPLPPYVDIRLWGSNYGIAIKNKQVLLYKASTLLFDKCDYIRICDVPILHDNDRFKNLRKLIRRNNSVGNMLFKHIGYKDQ